MFLKRSLLKYTRRDTLYLLYTYGYYRANKKKKKEHFKIYLLNILLTEKVCTMFLIPYTGAEIEI